MFKGLKERINKFLERLAKANKEEFGSKGPLCCHQASEKSEKSAHSHKIPTHK
jgi:hypothetical protein